MSVMELHINDVMTRNPVRLDERSTVLDAARCMREDNIGEVLVVREDDTVCGLVTDRDLVVRCLAKGLDPAATSLGDICTRHPVTIGADADLHAAAHLMREKAIRRLPVVDHDKPVGVVSIGDLALRMDATSALADISRAAPNN